MANHYNWHRPNYGAGGGRGVIDGQADLSEVILSREQRYAYEKFRAYQRVEIEALVTAAEALVQQQKAMAMMKDAGLTVKRITEITQIKGTKVRDMIDHGNIHLGKDVPDNE